MNGMNNKNKKTPKIITFDIETHPAKVYMYGKTHEPVVVKILEFETILSFSWKINNGKTHYIGLNTLPGYKPGQKNDKKLLIQISKILNDNKLSYRAGQNIDKFDIPKITERLIFHKLPSLQPLPTLDTWKLYSKVTSLPNNKLNTISQFNGIGEKITHSGAELFIACGTGDMKAWKINQKYNPRDVDLAWEDLKIILPYVKLSNTRQNGEIMNCPDPTCGSYMIKSKLRTRVDGKVQQWQCKKCGRYHTPNKIIKR